VALLRADPLSILNATQTLESGKTVPWAPTPGQFGCRRERYFTMADLIRHVEA
jgi:hypothetical protein